MNDRILKGFLEQQLAEGEALAQESDLLDLVPVGPWPPPVYLVDYRCKGVVKRHGRIVEHDRFQLGIRFPDSYLRRFDAAHVLTWLGPQEGAFHPAVRYPFCCVGRMEPGTPLVDLLYQIFEIITYSSFHIEMRESQSLNHEACVWARRNLHRFPLDDRPLRRRLRTRGLVGGNGSNEARSRES